MAEIALKVAAGAAVSAGNPGIGLALSLASSSVGATLDSQLLGGSGHHTQGSQLSDLTVQTSTYGRVIPTLFGKAKISGNVIWSTPIKEIATTTEISTGKGGGSSISSTEFSYSVTLAIAIGEGKIDSIVRVWADSLLIDPEKFSTNYRFYQGTEDQSVDPTIEAIEGINNAPAYRGLSYIVIEDLPLASFGNRIPNFSFEVNKFVASSNLIDGKVEDQISGMNLIPGSGEFVYDTVVQKKVSGEEVNGIWVPDGTKTRINQTNNSGKANVLVALDQLEETCPNIEWIGVVVTWFGDNLNAGLCNITPGVEFKTGATTEPDIWSVGSFTRDTATQITLDANNSPVYGGTPSDQSIIRLLDELKSRGYKVMFYPMFFMDIPNKPWRGRVTGTEIEITNFFNKSNGYNDFINHYINLVDEKVDAFVIGSELIGLTAVTDGSGNYPAVDALVSIAANAKSTLGSNVKITYAADWSEYHHTDGGWYNLDPLWSSPNIDIIGIDAYFPLTDRPQQGYDVQEIIDGWENGEGYDWYYSDQARTVKTPLTAEFAWKNIQWWWENNHVNPDTNTTGWIPQSKPIWFTEYGFPSVDGASNQPNVFYDPSSSESFFPHDSKGQIDFIAQRTALTATEVQWKDSTMVQQMFVWTWDARPFPYWPDLDSVWADTSLWETGHWIQGKLGISLLADIIREICLKSGLAESQIDVSNLSDLVFGYVLLNQQTARRALETLQSAYFFDVVERNNTLVFVSRDDGESITTITDELLDFNRLNGGPRISRAKEIDLPQKVSVSYLNPSFNYQVGSQFSQRAQTLSDRSITLNVPIVMYDQQAKQMAEISLYRAWQERNTYEFYLPSDFLAMEVGDRLTIVRDNVNHTVRITNITLGRNWITHIQAVADDNDVYQQFAKSASATTGFSPEVSISNSNIHIVDLPILPEESNQNGRLYGAIAAEESNWNGAVIYRSDDAGNSYQPVATANGQSIMGQATTLLPNAQTNYIDKSSTVDIVLQHGNLESISDQGLLNGGNLALIGGEIIQFRDATLLSENKYRLSYLLRGRLGTEWATNNHSTPEIFILLRSNLAIIPVPPILIDVEREYKAVTAGQDIDEVPSINITYKGNAFMPYSPVHINAQRNSNSDITISWIRRTRIDGQWRNNVDVPLGEDSESYEIDIINGSDVVRTLTTTSPTATYTEAQQISDFGSAQNQIEVNIYQLSTKVGRGHPGYAQI